MRAVWKYPIKMGTLAEVVELEMPTGARILHVDAQHNNVCLWALVDPEEKQVIRRFIPVMTGQLFDETDLRYIGTAMLESGMFLVHLFEEKA